MDRRDEVEILAEFLNGVCVDCAPISVSWSGRCREFSARRREMRDLAREFMAKRDAQNREQ